MIVSLEFRILTLTESSLSNHHEAQRQTSTNLQLPKLPKPYIHTVASLKMEEEQKEQLQPWHRKALIAGRKPLPDTAGVRPWIPCIRMETEEEKNARERQEKVLKRRVCSMVSHELSYK